MPKVALDLKVHKNSSEVFPQNLDKGFDPDDPAVKGIEDWDCSNNLDAMDPSLDNLVRVTQILEISDVLHLHFFCRG